MAAARAGCGRRPGIGLPATCRGAVPEETAYYLIRRGGAEIVDAVVEKTGVDGLLAGIVDRSAVQGPQAQRHPRPATGHGRVDTSYSIASPTAIFPARPSLPWPRSMAQDGLTADGACAALGIALRPREAWIKEADRVTFDGYRRDKGDTNEQANALPGGAGGEDAQRQGAGRGSGGVHQDEAVTRWPNGATQHHPFSERTDRFQGYRGPVKGAS